MQLAADPFKDLYLHLRSDFMYTGTPYGVLVGQDLIIKSLACSVFVTMRIRTELSSKIPLASQEDYECPANRKLQSQASMSEDIINLQRRHL